MIPSRVAWLGTVCSLACVPTLQAQLTITSSTPPPYTANNSITTSGTVTIGSGSTVTYQSGGVIYLMPGFTAAAGSTFTAMVAPLILSLTPTSGHGPSQTFTATYSDSAGYQDIKYALFLANTGVNGAGACYVLWAPANSFYLMNDAGTTWLGPITGGSSATLQNSQCTLSGATSSVSGSGNSLTVNFGITFLTAFDGLKNTYTLVYGSAGNSGWQQTGTWTAEDGPPPPDGSTDPRHIGVMSTRSYWGAAGEQIDLQSGNLNLVVPQMSAQLAAGSSVPFTLSYNSQIWRQDSGGAYNLGQDVGYGYGWRFQVGSVEPVYSGNPAQLSYYVYSDGTGAQYRLDQNNSNLWTSLQGTYVTYNANNSTLYFTNGTFWTMGDTSGPNEADAGTLYPTLIEDANGNQVVIRYKAGAGSGGSARIYEIQDGRGYCDNGDGNTYTFLFTYDLTPHLTQVTSCLQTTYGTTNFTYLTGQTLFSPFNSESFGTATLLESVSTFDSRLQSFQYTTAGEMTGMATPFGGSLSWGYRTYTYGNGVSYREVQTRQISPSSGTTYSWNVVLDSNPTSHAQTTVQDLGAGTQKVWNFQTASGPFLGLATEYQEQGAGSVTLLQKNYSWSQDSLGNVYTGSVTSILNPGQSYQAQTQTAQTLDIYGNVTNSVVTDYSGATRTYTATYVTNANYKALYLRNLLYYANVTPSGGSAITLVSNTYDTDSCPIGVGGLQNQTGLMLHDANYNVNFTYRGNPTVTSYLNSVNCYAYEINGAIYEAANGAGTIVNASLNPGTNYSLPSALMPNGSSSLATNADYADSYA